MKNFANGKDMIKRIEELEQIAINKYTESLNFDNLFDFYEELLRHLFSGDFNDSFSAPVLDGLSVDEANEIMNLACKYGFLCLYDGNLAYWLDSCESIPINDYKLIAAKILDNFNFLVELISESGTLCLIDLKSFGNCDMASEASVIEYLRNSFMDDDALKRCLIEIAKEDSEYANLSPNIKSKLCTFPQGILYYNTDEESLMVPVEKLISKVSEYEFIDEEIDSLDELISLVGEGSFENDIIMIHLEYNENDYGEQNLVR